MKPENLITDKIVEYCKTQQIIMILGPTKSGKVSIARKLTMETGHELFIADEFIERYGNEDALFHFEQELNHCYYSGKNAIFEGILCYRLLRKLIETGYYLPDMVIKIECSEATIRHFYSIEEAHKNINRIIGFNSGLNSIWKQCLETLSKQNKNLKVLTLNTSLF